MWVDTERRLMLVVAILATAVALWTITLLYLPAWW